MQGEFNCTKNDIEFNAEGTTLRGWLYLPTSSDNSSPSPVVVMAHGFASLKEMYLDRYAEQFAQSGIATLVFDHRNFGDSEGTPRQEINPWQQIEDYKHAITYASTLSEIDNESIGVWGSSYSGGHVLVLGATDKRVKCVVSQVPAISGSDNALRKLSGAPLTNLLENFAEDRKNRQKGEDPVYYSIIPGGEYENVFFKADDAIEFYSKGNEMSKNFENRVTLRSIELSRGYDPGAYISKISPTPLLLLVAEHDHITPTDLALKAYEEALEPKKLFMLPGEHFDPYDKYFNLACGAAADWFVTHLIQ